jgi:predicted DNA-binding mobile mystery protein A
MKIFKSSRLRNLPLVQLDEKFKSIRHVAWSDRSKKSWIKTIRKTLNMTTAQLASRLDTSQQSISRIENNESEGSVTLRTMHKVAEAMDCDFVYYFLPKTSLHENIDRQLDAFAKTLLNRVTHTMSLEQQDIDEGKRQQLFLDIRNQLAHMPTRRIWDQ